MRSIEECRQLMSHMLGIRTKREPAWIELARWIAGCRGVFSQGERDDPYDTQDITLFRAITAQALQKGASGMTSGMTPRNVSWFKPNFGERLLEEASGAREWLDQLDAKMKDTLAAGSFYQAIHQFNTDLLWAGCALIYCEKSESFPLRFECQQIGTFCIALDSENKLKTVLRLLRMTPANILQVFSKPSDKLPKDFDKLVKRMPFCQKNVWHLTELNHSKKGKPVDSLYWIDGEEDFLRKSGFNEMPFFFAVWHEGSTPYGTGPGDDCLSDAKQIDQMERMKLSGLAKIVDPPVAVPYTMKHQVDLQPGGINYVGGSEEIRPIIDLGPYAQSIRFLQEEIDRVAQRIEHGLMASIFASIPLEQRPRDMSATEFLERKREALQQLGPVISSYEPNVLTPLLYRVAMTLDREGIAPPLPPDLEQYPIFMKIEFLSPMANALRQTGAEASRALLQDVASILEQTQRTEILDKVDLDQAVDELAKGIGAPGSIIRSDDDVAMIRQQRNEQMQQQMQMDQAAQGLALAQGAQNIAAGQQAMQAQDLAMRQQQQMQNPQSALPLA